MVRQRPDGRFESAVTMDEQLKDRLENAVDNDPEASEAELLREGLRKELQNRES